MADIHIEKSVVQVKINFGEVIAVGFQPDGLNAPLEGGKTIYFQCSYHVLPSGRVGLGIHFPECLYRSGNQFMLIDDPNGADKLEIGDMVLEKVPVLSEKKKMEMER